MYKAKGVVKTIGPTVNVTEKFSKREFVIEMKDGMYPQSIQFQMAQDKCSLLDTVGIGQDVEVSFNLRGREWTDPKTGQIKVFNTLDAFRIEADGPATPKPVAVAVAAEPVAAVTTATPSEEEELPF
jgi:hypothetical protein